MLSSLSTRMLNIYCTKWPIWQFLPCVRSPQSREKIPILASQCVSRQKGWLRDCVQTWKPERAEICSLRWGFGIPLWTYDLSCYTMPIYNPGTALSYLSSTVLIHEEGKEPVCSQLGHSYAAAWVLRLNPGFWALWLRQHKPLPACKSGLLDTLSDSKLGAHISNHGLRCPGELWLLYEAIFIREYGVIPATNIWLEEKTIWKDHT